MHMYYNFFSCFYSLFLEFIKAHPYLTERLVIICNKDEEVQEIVAALKSISAIYTHCTSKSTANQIGNSFPVMLCVILILLFQRKCMVLA